MSHASRLPINYRNAIIIDMMHKIISELTSLYRLLSLNKKEQAAEYYYNCFAALKRFDWRGAYLNFQFFSVIISDENINLENIKNLFVKVMSSDDCINENTFLMINRLSPFYQAIDANSKKYNFKIKSNNFDKIGTLWIKDYIISTGDNILLPTIKMKDPFIWGNNYQHIDHRALSIKNNKSLYHNKLNTDQHHRSEGIINYDNDSKDLTENLLYQSSYIRNIILEGGNFFCTHNKAGVKYFLIGENVISENHLAHHLDFNKDNRKKILHTIANNLNCDVKKILVIPQWTYHLDLQMSYLGSGEFIIHSFDQSHFDFGNENKNEIKNTFKKLKQFFEKDIIDEVIKILTENNFSVNKVFGCLFQIPQNIYSLDFLIEHNRIPLLAFEKNLFATFMNGITIHTKESKVFLTADSENEEFKKYFSEQLQNIGVKVEFLKINSLYLNHYGSTTNYIAMVHGGLRCQSTIINKSLIRRLSYQHYSELNTKKRNLNADTDESKKNKRYKKK